MQVLGASFDSVEKNAKFAQKFEFNFPLLCDVDRKIGVAYGTTTRNVEKELLVVAKAGTNV